MRDEAVAQVAWLQAAVREALGDAPSELFLQRVDRALGEGAADPQALARACQRVVGMVRLFIDEQKAAALAQRLRALGALPP